MMGMAVLRTLLVQPSHKFNSLKCMMNRLQSSTSYELESRSQSGIFLTVILVVIVIILLIIGIATLSSGEGTRGANILTCPVGQCATNLNTGIKRCAQGQVVSYNPGIEVCNSPTLCDNVLTPFAQNSDKSTNSSGVCSGDSVCPCLSKAQCADYVTTIFSTRNGDPYTTLEGQRIAFAQNGGNVSTPKTATAVSHQTQTGGTTPLTLNNAVTQFCQIPIAWLNRTIPGCSSINEVNGKTLETCLQGGGGCLSGTVAIIPQDGVSLLQSPVACVRGTGCQAGLLPVWNDQLGAVVCQPYPT